MRKPSLNQKRLALILRLAQYNTFKMDDVERACRELDFKTSNPKQAVSELHRMGVIEVIPAEKDKRHKYYRMKNLREVLGLNTEELYSLLTALSMYVSAKRTIQDFQNRCKVKIRMGEGSKPKRKQKVVLWDEV